MQRQRNRRYLLLGLIPLGGFGAWAIGLIPPSLDLQFKSSTASVTSSKSVAPVSPKPIAAAPANSPAPAPAKAKFGIDVARISGDGSSVIAGFARPSSRITVLADGKPIGAVSVDQSGDWILVTEHKFATLDPKLEIVAGDLTSPKVASLTTGSDRAATPTPKRTAAAVAKEMMMQLEQLTKAAAGAQPPVTASSASGAALALKPSAGASGPDQPPSVVPVRPRLAAASGPNQADATMPPTPAKLVQSLPVPVQFVYREATFTPQGKAAAALLLKYFKAKRYLTVALSGHADERGTHAANLKLSQERLERIERFLRDGGYTGKLTLLPKGATEKYLRVERSKFPVEELYQLDRRVEVVAAN